ncbi:hypothetical protein F5Y11DRAFT_332017 [Daldinia sp. FL1419]|nr:hypothetical protein F5Y11DRAFT_332017 [Daldinia sp. FL1419]
MQPTSCPRVLVFSCSTCFFTARVRPFIFFIFLLNFFPLFATYKKRETYITQSKFNFTANAFFPTPVPLPSTNLVY